MSEVFTALAGAIAFSGLLIILKFPERKKHRGGLENENNQETEDGTS